MSLICPNFDVVDHFFPFLARGFFPKLLEKALASKVLLRPVVCYGLRPASDGMQSTIIFGSVLLKNVDFK